MGPDSGDSWPSPDLVASIALAFYAALPKTGKPQPHEFTVFAALVASSDEDGSLRVVAAGSGTKCLPGSHRTAGGSLINDCHAEVLTRRALMAWLYGEAELAIRQHRSSVQQDLQQESQKLAQSSAGTKAAAASPGRSVLELQGRSGRLQLRSGVRLHMYISQPPCGDASIITLPAGTAATPSITNNVVLGSAKTDSSTGVLVAAASEQPGAAQRSNEQDAAAGLSEATLRVRTGAKALKLMQQGLPSGPDSAGQQDALVQQPGKVQATEGSDAGCSLRRPQEQEHGTSRNACHVQSDTGGDTEMSRCADGQGPSKQNVTLQLPGASDVETGLQEVGVARRKPGKGEPTLSMSCSDKLARWALLGLQGSLLAALLTQPIRLMSLVVGLPPTLAGEQGEEVLAAARAALQRAVPGRATTVAGLLPSEQQALVTTAVAALRVSAVQSPPVDLGLAPTEQRKVGSGASVAWYAPPGCCLQSGGSQQSMQQKSGKAKVMPAPSSGTTEVLAAGAGCKAGTSKATRDQPRHWPRLCRAAQLERFCCLVEQHAESCMASCSTEGTAEGCSSNASAQGEDRRLDAQCSVALLRAVQAAAGSGTGAIEQKDTAGWQSAMGHLRACSYATVKALCGDLSGLSGLWSRAVQPPSPFRFWIPKPQELQQFTAQTMHEALKH